MYITMAEMVVILDTIRGSVSTDALGALFGYSKKSRCDLHEALMARLRKERIGVMAGEDQVGVK